VSADESNLDASAFNLDDPRRALKESGDGFACGPGNPGRRAGGLGNGLPLLLAAIHSIATGGIRNVWCWLADIGPV
jgi:hypothetical protein